MRLAIQIKYMIDAQRQSNSDLYFKLYDNVDLVKECTMRYKFYAFKMGGNKSFIEYNIL